MYAVSKRAVEWSVLDLDFDLDSCIGSQPGLVGIWPWQKVFSPEQPVGFISAHRNESQNVEDVSVHTK